MRKDNNRFTCPVCGFPGLNEPAYSKDGNPSHEICPSCGTEFGYDDATRSHSELRKNWVQQGCKWSSSVISPPENWDPRLQLDDAQFEY